MGTLAAILSAVATLIGAGKGAIELYQASETLSAPAPMDLLAERSDREHYTDVSKILALSNHQVAALMERLRRQFMMNAVLVVGAWAAILSLAILFPLTRLIMVILVLCGVVLALLLAQWPSAFSRMAKLKEELTAKLYTEENAAIADKGVQQLLRLIADLGILRKAATASLNSYRAHSLMPLLQLRPRQLSSAEQDLLDAHVKLSSLVASIQAKLLTQRLRKMTSETEQVAQKEIRTIVHGAFTQLLNNKLLQTQPSNRGAEYERWKSNQKTV
jgi:hypothetical protein